MKHRFNNHLVLCCVVSHDPASFASKICRRLQLTGKSRRRNSSQRLQCAIETYLHLTHKIITISHAYSRPCFDASIRANLSHTISIPNKADPDIVSRPAHRPHRLWPVSLKPQRAERINQSTKFRFPVAPFPFRYPSSQSHPFRVRKHPSRLVLPCKAERQSRQKR